jgi:uncharacterized protein YndB with AHSA1/START domain
MTDIALVVRRVIRATPARVFEAWTTPSELLRWWGPRSVRCTAAEIDLRVGGSYRIANELPDGRVLWIVGEFEEIVIPHRLVYTWRIQESAPCERVTVRFEPRDGRTEVIVVHERIVDARTRQEHQTGWRECLDGLERMFTW